MDISLDIHPTVRACGAKEPLPAQNASAAPKPGSANLTVSEALRDDGVSAVSAAEVPPDALSRDDDLGKLVSAAFNLPPPPMPVFE